MDFPKFNVTGEYVKRVIASILLVLLIALLISYIVNSRYETQTFQMRGSPGIVEIDKWTGKIWLKMLDKAISESYENQNSLPINDPDIDALDRDVKSGLIGSEELPHKGKLVLGLKRGEIRLDELSPEDLALVGKTPKDVELFKKQGWVEVK